MVSFRFAGVLWRVSFAFLAGVTFFLLVDGGGFALALLGAAVLHESGHLLAMAAVGAPVRLICLGATGMRIVRGGRLSYTNELLIMSAGVLTNLLAAGLLLCGGAGLIRFSAANAAIAIFQLLPLGGLDGGSLVELVMVRLLGAARGSTAAHAVAAVFATVALLAVLWYGLDSGWSMGLLLLSLLLACAILAPRSF